MLITCVSSVVMGDITNDRTATQDTPLTQKPSSGNLSYNEMEKRCIYKNILVQVYWEEAKLRNSG